VLVARKNGKPPRDFTGKLPFPWPADAVSPVRQALFPAGYGLDYAHAKPVGPVNEAPHVDLVASASEGTYLTLGKVPAPWHLGLDDGVVSRATDIAAQEDAIQFTWKDHATAAIDGPPVDLMRQLDEEFVLRLDGRVEATAGTAIGISMGGATLSVDPKAQFGKVGAPFETRIPLRCFHDAGADFKAVGIPVRITAEKGFILSLRNIRIEPVGTAISCPAKAQ
jgi:beta-glucosidase